ncbi:MAG: Uma2 family endonuclease [Anaerolineae bacterium]|nr:Uma2 family endonuclease [Anaerolineae bacterium]
MADLAIEQRLLTLDDLLAMADDTRVEIIDGEIVPMTAAGVTHGLIGGNIYHPLRLYLEQHDIGVVLPDGVTYLMHSPVSGLKDAYEPDVSFMRHENVPAGWNPEKPHPGVPDLAVEIVSPGNDADALQQKRHTYLEKGTQQVWFVYPRLREVHVYSPDAVRIYSGAEAIDVSSFFPGLEPLNLAVIFKLPIWAQ